MERTVKKESAVQLLGMKMTMLSGDIADEISKAFGFGLEMSDLEGLNARCAEVVMSHADLQYAMVTGRDGTILFHSDGGKVGESAGELFDPSTAKAGATVMAADQRHDGVYTLARPIIDNRGEYRGAVVLGGRTEPVRKAR